MRSSLRNYCTHLELDQWRLRDSIAVDFNVFYICNYAFAIT